MTMHLAQGLTTTSTKKHKVKLTKTQLELYRKDLADHNRAMKRAGRHSERMGLEEYINWRHGVRTERQAQNKTTIYKPSNAFRRGDTSHIKSLDTGVGVATKPEKKEYTGTLVKGIATMHKSNAVPIIDEEQATDIAKMRR